ncbi:ferritin-1, chloroplastic-like [Lolium rigidum]|uniref:ferritin-1, chloroplastic-like n=1 Tax=Lolium rigidum TaxID=89674 RepID=UPI001F5DCB42|nr:ferritin-1, chloroplastic-like [Lolium rigidum]
MLQEEEPLDASPTAAPARHNPAPTSPSPRQPPVSPIPSVAHVSSIVTPLTEFDHPEKGDALYAMELALALEKLVNEKLHNLHSVATRCNDPQLTDFVESEFLQEQVDAIKKISEYVSQLRRVGKGHGVWHFDQMLLEEAA